jgi:hypothetical protein
MEGGYEIPEADAMASMDRTGSASADRTATISAEARLRQLDRQRAPSVVPKNPESQTPNVVNDIDVEQTPLEPIPEKFEVVLQDSIPISPEATPVQEVVRVSKMFKDQEVLPGVVIDVATYPQDSSHYMAYLPETDNIYIFGKTYDEIESGHETVTDIGALHETDHAIYMRLSASEQTATNNAVMEIVTSNPEAKKVFQKFVKALYSRPGADYLHAHQFSNVDAEKILTNDDNKAGIKDNRFLDAAVNDEGKVERLRLSLVLTEFFAYMSTGHHDDLLDDASLESINAKELVELTTTFRKQYIDTSEAVTEALAKNGGHGLRREVPDFKKYVRGTQ